MKPPYRLVPDVLSTDTIECLSQLHQDAKAGQVIGIAFVAVYKERRFIANVAGECHRNPRHARSLLDDLHDDLGIMLRKRENR